MRRLTKDLYSAKRLDDQSWEVLLCDASHPVFKAHFEGNPLVPAFLQIDILSELLDRELIGITKSKFKQPVLPNDRVVYKVVKQIENAYSVKIFKDDKVASEIKVKYA